MAIPSDGQRKKYTYPSPYMDIAGTWYPASVKELFRWCKYYYYSNPIISSIIYKLSEYPITDFIYELEDAEDEKNKNLPGKPTRELKNIFEMVLNLKSFLLEVGLDYYTYGNGFVSIHTPFSRFLTCPKCNEKYSVGSVDYRLKNFKFMFSCTKCDAMNVEAKVVDIPIYDPEKINLVRWNAENIQIKYNDITGRSVYYYRIPNKLRNSLIRGEKDIVEDVPLKILEALSERKDLRLNSENIFHFKRPTLAESDMGWGKPIVMSIMKDIFYLQTLRKAQEAIAIQHIVPLDILFPTANGSVDPYTHLDLQKWKNKIELELQRWRRDPNYISIMPIPVGISRVGGDGRMLLITPEIESVLKNIAAGLGVPLEFMFGGLSWSGSSVSLRTLENHFLTTRQHYHRFMIWLVKRLTPVLKLPKNLTIRMVDFKMADDVQQKQLTIQLNQNDKISDRTLLTEFGFDYQKEKSRKMAEIQDRNDLLKKSSEAQAHANGESQKIQMNYQMEIQDAQRKKAEEDARKEGRGTSLANQQSIIGSAFNTNPTADQSMPQMPQGEQVPKPESPDNTMPMEVDWKQEVAAVVQKMNMLSEDKKKEFLARIKEEMPTLHSLVMEYLQTNQVSRGKGGVDMRPAPEQKPPRRAGEA